eukprot:TRINITY_DN6372_c0_g2_i1.p1 TRINITY_DN6372_c0_g2~~TRINITY_DN6372_c0_g2_i1.p1  ORF type:complete len:625 (-),score=116.57 TRINITY_DN6372_c0_g2_i1:1145-3019(-)
MFQRLRFTRSILTTAHHVVRFVPLRFVVQLRRFASLTRVHRCEELEPLSVIQSYRQVVESGAPVDKAFGAKAIEAFAMNGDTQEVTNMLAKASRLEASALYCGAIRGYSNANQPRAAEDLLSTALSQRIFLQHAIFNDVLRSYLEADDLTAASKFKQSIMNPKHVQADYANYMAFVNRTCASGNMPLAVGLVEEWRNLKGDPDATLYQMLMEGYVQQGSLEEAQKVMQLYTSHGGVPTVGHITTMIHGYANRGDHPNAQSMFDMLTTLHIPISVEVWKALLKSYVHGRYVKGALAVLQKMRSAQMGFDDEARALMVGLYVKTGDVGKVQKMITTLPAMTAVEKLHTMMSAYRYQNHTAQMQNVYDQWLADGNQPDVEAATLLISRWAHDGSPRRAQDIFDQLLQQKCQPTALTWGALLSAYVEKSDIAGAHNVVEQLKGANVPLTIEIQTLRIKLFVGQRMMKEARAVFDETQSALRSREPIVYSALMQGLGLKDRVDLIKRGISRRVFVGPSLTNLFTIDLHCLARMVATAYVVHHLDVIHQNVAEPAFDLRIITGRGRHSKNREPVLRGAVTELLTHIVGPQNVRLEKDGGQIVVSNVGIRGLIADWSAQRARLLKLYPAPE